MTIQRNKEIKAVVTALTVAAAMASGFLTIRDADAAPPKKSAVTVKRAKKAKPVYVKMMGNRRAAETRAAQLYNQALAQKAADEQAVIDARLAASAAAAEAEASVIAAAPVPGFPQTTVVNPYGNYGQQVIYPGIGGFGPAVVTGGYASPGGFNLGFPTGGGGFSSSGGFGYPGGSNFGYQNAGGFGNGSGFVFSF